VCVRCPAPMAGAGHRLRELPNRLGPDVTAPWCGRRAWGPAIVRRFCAVGHVQVMRGARRGGNAVFAAKARRRAYPAGTGLRGPLSARTAVSALQEAWRKADPRSRTHGGGDAGLRASGRRLPDGRKWALVRAEAARRLDGTGQRDDGRAAPQGRNYSNATRTAFIEAC